MSGGDCCTSCARGLACEGSCPHHGHTVGAQGGMLQIADVASPPPPATPVRAYPGLSIVGASCEQAHAMMVEACRRARTRGEIVGAFRWPWEPEPKPAGRRPVVIVRAPAGRALPPARSRGAAPANACALPPSPADAPVRAGESASPWVRGPLSAVKPGWRVQTDPRRCSPPSTWRRMVGPLAPAVPVEPPPSPDDQAMMEQVEALLSSLSQMGEEELNETIASNPWISDLLAEMGILGDGSAPGYQSVAVSGTAEDLRRADDVFSSVLSTIAPIVPYGGLVNTINEGRRGLMYPGGAQAGPGLILEMQTLWRQRWKGDKAADAAARQLKAAAATDDASAKRWAVYVAVAKDDLRRAAV